MDQENRVDLLNLLLNISFVSWIFVLGPPFLVILVVGSLLGIDLKDWIILLTSILLFFWVRFLEKRVGVKTTFPIIPIPWLWVAWARIFLGILDLIWRF